MKRAVLALAALLVAVAVWAQPNTAPDWPFGGTLGDVQRRYEYDPNGDRIRVNIRGVSATPTPAASNRCVIYTDAVENALKASCDGGPYQTLATGVGTNCICASTGEGSTAVGASAVGSGDSATAIGVGANASGADAICFGYGSTCTGDQTFCSGVDTVCIGDDVIAFSTGAIITASDVICLSPNGCDNVGNDAVFGGENAAMSTAYFGKGRVSTAPTTATISGTGGSGSNVAGAELALRGGRGTGTGIGGNVSLNYCAAGSSGSSLNSCAPSMTYNGNTGNLLVSTGFELQFGSGAAIQLYYDAGLTAFVIDPNANFVEIPGALRVNQIEADSGGVINQGQNTTVPEQANITATSFQFDVANVPAFYITADNSYTLASQPTLTAGQNGQQVWIWNADGAATITFNDDGNGGVASNLQLGASTRALAQNDGLCLYYLGVLGDWLECGFVNN